MAEPKKQGARAGAHRYGRRIGGALSVGLMALASAVVGGPAGAAEPSEPRPVEDQERGLVYDGLRRETTGPCAGLFRVAGTSLCTHGPDATEPGRTAGKDSPELAASLAGRTPQASQALCIGDGNSGERVHVLYVRAADRTDRYASVVSALRSFANGADDIFLQSAQETGGIRRIRFLHDRGCQPIVSRVTISSSADDTFSASIQAVQAQGYNRSDRKYMMFVDANIYCGIANIRNDDQPGQANANNNGPAMYGRTDAGCWGANVPAHELMHNLGAVQRSAPNSSYYSGTPDGWHCEDDFDLMCYKDGGQVVIRQVCLDPGHESLFDCRHDDYYTTLTPRPGSYLATKWNAANNKWLLAGAQSYWGYVWAHSPTSGGYFPSSTYSFNSRGGTNSITRQGVGQYTVNMPLLGLSGGIAHANAYGSSNHHCKVVSWIPSGSTMQVRVRCFTPNGALADTLFTASYARPIAQGPLGHVWANQPTTSSYTPATSYNYTPSGHLNTISRNGVGNYTVRMPFLGASAGDVQVTAYGSGSERCKVGSWFPSGSTQLVNVLCSSVSGRPVDTMFSMTFMNARSMFSLRHGEAGYAWADQPTAASYSPNSLYRYNSANGTVSITRSGVGRYLVTFSRMSVVGGYVNVTAYGSGSEHCKVGSWVPVGGPATRVSVNCFTSSGVAVDTRYDISYNV